MDNTDEKFGGPECACEFCTGTGHCAGNPWLNLSENGHRMYRCPRHSDLSRSYLRRRKVLAVGQADDLRFDNGCTRLWLSRCGTEDGEPYANKVTVEALVDGAWKIYRTYQAF
jgi:hypothetical protein